MEKIIIVSNRLPVTISLDSENLTFQTSTGGLATGLNSAFDNKNTCWIGWPGIYGSNKVNRNKEITTRLKERNMSPVFLSKEQVKLFYEGFSNATLWPLFHYFPRYVFFEEKHWNVYKEVNELFCEEVVKQADENSIIWIHDYHLLLLPAMVREKLPNAKIGFFQHIPFPSYDTFRLLPVREEIIKGVLGADLIGFHTYDDVKHFLTSQNRLIGIENRMGEINYGKRIISVDAFPMGINYSQFEQMASSEEAEEEVVEYLSQFGNTKIILSVDRLDYSKGVPERLKAFDLFLERYPEYRTKVSLMMIVAPSREKVAMYKKLKSEIDELVGNINARYRTVSWTPILHFYRSFPLHSLPSLYRAADVALITPLRDGMNLVCKEYVASRTDQTGVLILSEMAGAAKELHEAIIINPYNISETAEAIKTALILPVNEQKRRMIEMQRLLKEYDVKHWANLFIDTLKLGAQRKEQLSMREVNKQISQKIINEFSASKNRILFLDYDGTLVPLQDKPEYASPDEQLISILNKITSIPDTKLVIITGRDKDTMEKWLGGIHNIDIVAEHGLWTKKNGLPWQMNIAISNDWKERVRPILKLFVSRTPGSFIEEKDYSLAWHYRQADQELSEFRGREIIDILQYFTGNLRLSVIEGKKVIEIKSSLINKGTVVSEWIKENTDFILAAGDDWTDEDMFKAMPDMAYTIKVGNLPSVAKYSIYDFNDESPFKLRSFLRVLSEIQLTVKEI